MSKDLLYDLQDVSVFYEQSPALYKIRLYSAYHETIGIVGESGSGKSTVAKTLAGLQRPTEGKVLFRGTNIYTMTCAEQRFFRKEVQIIFQDPDASMNPRRPAIWHLHEALKIHFPTLSPHEQTHRIHQALSKVQLSPNLLPLYSYELSGGQKQRLSIAKALLVEPTLIILDEPLSSLDAALRKSTLHLLASLQQEFGVAYLFITHDLSTLHAIAKYVAVIYRGVIIEFSNTTDLYNNPLHPYTQTLLSCIPIPNPKIAKLKKPIIHPSTTPHLPPQKACVFAHRCPYATTICQSSVPTIHTTPTGHAVACHRVDEIITQRKNLRIVRE